LFISDIDETGIAALVERCRRSIESKPVDYEDCAIPVTASFGIAGVDPDKGLNTAIMFADHALYQAKKEGRNGVVLHKPDAGNKTSEPPCKDLPGNHW
jgi:diguanylate cyclase (GGDEF)-like protein